MNLVEWCEIHPLCRSCYTLSGFCLESNYSLSPSPSLSKPSTLCSASPTIPRRILRGGSSLELLNWLTYWALSLILGVVFVSCHDDNNNNLMSIQCSSLALHHCCRPPCVCVGGGYNRHGCKADIGNGRKRIYQQSTLFKGVKEKKDGGKVSSDAFFVRLANVHSGVWL